MKNFSCFNFTNETFDSNGVSISFSNALEGVLGIAIVWICCAYVIYISFHFIKYLIQKAPNMQTMLDGFYGQYFASLIAMAMSCSFMQLLIEMNAVLNVENQTLTWITSYMTYSTALFESLSLATSCVARAFSIFWPSEIEAIDDKTCWFLNG